MTGMEIAVGAALAASAVSAVGAVAQGQQQSRMANYNAQVAEVTAQSVRDQAAAKEADFRRQSQRLRSSMRAGMAANGLDLDGSMTDVLSDSVVNAEVDALRIRHAGTLEDLRLQSQAAADRAQASAARMGGYFSAGSALLRGASTAASLYGAAPAKSSLIPDAYPTDGRGQLQFDP